MQLVANFGEIRANHWHMGLDIRTQHRVNLPVHAAADGYISRVSVEPGGFGQAIYINHPNGFTTVYGHLNVFFPALAKYVKEHQYAAESWNIDLTIPADLFPVKKGEFIALSGSTGASEGPHVHFEIRDTRTGKNLNPLLFGFPIPDAVPPTIVRLAMYNGRESIYRQSPQFFSLRRSGPRYTLSGQSVIRTGSDVLYFGITTFDRFTNSNNPNGIYKASIFLDDAPVSGFALNNIDYNDTRYINAQLDYRLKADGGPNVQLISALPGDYSGVYQKHNEDGLIHLSDSKTHAVRIEVQDANLNTAQLSFLIEYDPALAKPFGSTWDEVLAPNNVNVVEKDGFEAFTTDRTLYDTVPVRFEAVQRNAANAISPLYTFLGAAIPAHDSATIRIRPDVAVDEASKGHAVIKNIAGDKSFVEKAVWEKGFLSAKFRQFGTYQAFVDNVPPTVNAPGPGGDVINLSGRSSIVFVPHDNFNTIRSVRVALDGNWLRFSNDKGHAWVYSFDEKFPAGAHELKVTVVDEAGNETVKAWRVKR